MFKRLPGILKGLRNLKKKKTVLAETKNSGLQKPKRVVKYGRFHCATAQWNRGFWWKVRFLDPACMDWLHTCWGWQKWRPLPLCIQNWHHNFNFEFWDPKRPLKSLVSCHFFMDFGEKCYFGKSDLLVICYHPLCSKWVLKHFCPFYGLLQIAFCL